MADFDIGSILNSLSADDMENIKKIASDFLGGGEAEKPPAKQETPSGNIPDFSKLSGMGMPDLSQLSAIMPVLQMFNKSDDRLDFINALKPLLSETRKRKADEAMNLLRLMSVLPALKERGML